MREKIKILAKYYQLYYISFQTLASNMVLAGMDMTFEFNWIKDKAVENMNNVTEMNTT